MLCLRCKNEDFRECMADTQQLFRGEDFTVQAPAMACTECGWQTMTDAQADVLRLLVANAYRKKHDLLTSAQISAARQRLGLSQQAFAQRVGVGVASLKRWETGCVQDKSNDNLIRMNVNQMMDKGTSVPSLLDWFTGNCTKNVVTLPSVGIRLLPHKNPAAPPWTIKGQPIRSRSSLRKNVTDDPAFAPAA